MFSIVYIISILHNKCAQYIYHLIVNFGGNMLHFISNTTDLEIFLNVCVTFLLGIRIIS